VIESKVVGTEDIHRYLIRLKADIPPISTSLGGRKGTSKSETCSINCRKCHLSGNAVHEHRNECLIMNATSIDLA
jgi:hypothetical protein